MEIQGLTPVDTLYEFTGLSLGHRISEYLIWNGYFVGFVIAAALLRLYYVGARRGSFADMAAYPIYVLVIGLLLWPVEVSVSAPGSDTYYGGSDGKPVTGQDGLFWYPDVGSEEGQAALGKAKSVPVPRVLAFVTTIVDALQQSLVRDLDKTLHDASFRWLRVAAVNQSSRIFDLELRRDFGTYLNSCYWPAMAEGRAQEAKPWEDVPLAGLPIDGWLLEQYKAGNQMFSAFERTSLFPDRPVVSCADLHTRLFLAVNEHVIHDPFHAGALATYASLAEKEGNRTLGADAYGRFYIRRLLYNETYVVGQDELGTVRYALPEFDLVDGATINLTYTNSTAQLSDSFWGNLLPAAKALPDVVAALLSGVSEWWAQKSLGPAAYYRMSALGPYIYGFVTGILLMLFPVAGLLAFWPQWWTALVNFLKVFVSVKLWPVLWAYISGMIQVRTEINPDDPNGLQAAFGSEGMLPALAGMYMLTPVLSFMIVQIAHQAGAISMAGLVGHGATGSIKAGADAVASGVEAGAAGAVWVKGKLAASD